MGSDVGQISPTASLHRDHSISYALVCEKELSHTDKSNTSKKTTEIPIWCASKKFSHEVEENNFYPRVKYHMSIYCVQECSLYILKTCLFLLESMECAPFFLKYPT